MTNIPMDALRKQLRQARESARLSRAELARRLGITETQIIRIENGTRSTTIERAQQWLVACGFSVETISVGQEEHAALLATAIGALHEDDLQPIGRVVRAWRALPPSVRTAIIALIAPYAKEDPSSD